MLYDDEYYRRLEDEDAMLAENRAKLYDYLRGAPQDIWLYTIRRFNWDIHSDIIFWMLNQPECDFSVAVHAFHYSDPHFYIRERRPLVPEPHEYAIFSLVILNWQKGFYRQHVISVGEEYCGWGTKLREMIAEAGDDLPFTVPEEFLAPEGGRPLDIPDDMVPENVTEIWRIYHALEIGVHDLPPGPERTALVLKRGARVARNAPYRLRDIPVALSALKYHKHFEDLSDFGDWLLIRLRNPEASDDILQRLTRERSSRLAADPTGQRSTTGSLAYGFMALALCGALFWYYR